VPPRLPGQLRRLNRDARLTQGARLLRERLPGDERYGDPLSTGGERPSEVAGRQLTELTAGSPGVLRELGLGAVQVWQALAEVQGRGRGDLELAIVFTDLTGFSTWALEHGDTVAVELLRDVAEVLEPALTDHGGTIVKRLGDGVMAVFADPQAAVDGVLDARGRVGALEHAGHRPRLRAGLHLGRPRRLGADYLGVDVNVAARLVDAAAAGEVLASDALLSRIDTGRVRTKRKRWFRAKGTPKGLQAFSLEPAPRLRGTGPARARP
jgi:adenylate cyclase